jgi:hypothetical protein
MAVNILTITASGMAPNFFLQVSESLGPGFYPLKAPVPVPPFAFPDTFWVDLNDPSAPGPIQELIAGSTAGPGLGGLSIVGPDIINQLNKQYCYQVDFFDNTVNFVGQVSLRLTTNAFNKTPGLPAGLAGATSDITVNAGIAVANLMWTPGQNGGGLWTFGACCVHEDNAVQTAQGKRVPIKQVCAGDRLLDVQGHAVPVLYNIKYETPCCQFVKISQGALGKQLPERDLLMRRGHTLLHEGAEVQVEALIDGDKVTEVETERAALVYALCTARKAFVLVEGVPVATWAETAWNNYVQNNEHGRHIRWSKQ